jgi:hypothetical protein
MLAGRLRAKWRQVDTENREAIEVRRQWMALIGYGEAEINEACDNAFDLSLEDELEQLGAAIRGKRGGGPSVRITTS